MLDQPKTQLVMPITIEASFHVNQDDIIYEKDLGARVRVKYTGDHELQP